MSPGLASPRKSELTALERGRHALNSRMTERAYADATGRKHQTVRNDIFAAEVSQTCADVGAELSRHFSQLVEIHPASKWLWPGLVNAVLGAG